MHEIFVALSLASLVIAPCFVWMDEKMQDIDLEEAA
jgi:hypothetical protein